MEAPASWILKCTYCGKYAHEVQRVTRYSKKIMGYYYENTRWIRECNHGLCDDCYYYFYEKYPDLALEPCTYCGLNRLYGTQSRQERKRLTRLWGTPTWRHVCNSCKKISCLTLARNEAEAEKNQTLINKLKRRAYEHRRIEK